MYLTLLVLHNVLRWLVLASGLVVVVVALAGWFRRLSWARRGRIPSQVYVGVLDLQVLVGIVLYVISPLIRGAWRDFGNAMANDQLRFFAVEHGVGMLVAFLLARFGTVMIGRAQTDVAKFKRAAIWYSLSVLVIAISIPWWRPLLRGV